IFRRQSCLAAAGRNQGAFALGPLAGQLAGAAHGLGLLARLLLGRLFVIIAQLHFAEDAFALQLLLERAQRLVNIVIANDYLQRSTALSKHKICLDESGAGQKNHTADQRNRSPWPALYPTPGGLSTARAGKMRLLR